MSAVNVFAPKIPVMKTVALMTPTQSHLKTYSIFDRAAFEQNVKNIAFPAKSYEEDIAQMEERFATNPYNDAFTDDTMRIG
jgi:hypothetical protein